MGAAGRILLNTRSRDGYSELTSEPTATRRDDFYENATGSPQKWTQTAISLLQNKVIQSLGGGLSAARRRPF
jgi:hypothetical protein